MPQGVAVITRSTGVVGRAIALQLADDGFDIALSADADQQASLSQLERKIQSKGVRCQSYICDLLKEESVKSLISGVARDLGGMDVYAAQQMIKQDRGGRLIVTMPLGNTGVGASFPDLSALNASIFAVRGLSQATALELGPYNITVNTVPHGLLDDHDDGPYGYQPAINKYTQIVRQSKMVKDVREIVASFTPLPQKNATGQDVAHVVCLLASKQNNFMTGLEAVGVNGGLTMS